eukprot:8287839-Pyramimonas_sp.AAC.1
MFLLGVEMDMGLGAGSDQARAERVGEDAPGGKGEASVMGHGCKPRLDSQESTGDWCGVDWLSRVWSRLA